MYFQITAGFTIFFPLNVVLFPLTLVEWILRYQITFGGGDTGVSPGAGAAFIG